MMADLLDSNLATGLVGVAGVLLGLFADRMLQRQGKVRCEMDPIELHISSGNEKGTSYTVYRLPVRADYLPDPNATGGNFYGKARVRCNINAKLFNKKEVKTGLRDVVLAFDSDLSTPMRQEAPIASCAERVPAKPTTKTTNPSACPTDPSRTATGSNAPARPSRGAMRQSSEAATNSTPPVHSAERVRPLIPLKPVEPVRRSCRSVRPPKARAR